jgi:lysozyme
MIPDVLIKLVSHYESLHDGDLKQIGLQPKMCPAGYWTEGYGSLVLDQHGKKIQGFNNRQKAYDFRKIQTKEQAIEKLKLTLEDFSQQIDSLNLDLNINQHSALVSFAYNVGFSALKSSTLLQLIKEKASASEIDIAFRAWNKGGGKVLAGLVARRTSEALLFIKGELKFFN